MLPRELELHVLVDHPHAHLLPRLGRRRHQAGLEQLDGYAPAAEERARLGGGAAVQVRQAVATMRMQMHVLLYAAICICTRAAICVCYMHMHVLLYAAVCICMHSMRTCACYGACHVHGARMRMPWVHAPAVEVRHAVGAAGSVHVPMELQ